MPPLPGVGDIGRDQGEMNRDSREMSFLPVGTAARLLKRCRQECRCWVWTGCKSGDYGQIKVGGKTQWAHRVSYCCFNGVIPEKMTVHHLCGNRMCINPRHLELMTPEDNAENGNVPEEDKVPF